MDLHFRNFRQADMERCSQISAESWPIVSQLIRGGDSSRFMEFYVEMSLLDSDYREVCCDSRDRVIGLLLGSINREKLSGEERQKRKILMEDYIKGRYGEINNKYRLIFTYLLSELKVWFFCRKLQSQVVLFMVDKSHQGMGIGKTLMSRYIEKAKGERKNNIYLYTDIESNWMFYEKYGFKRYRNFYDNGLSFMSGKKIHSFIYCMQL